MEKTDGYVEDSFNSQSNEELLIVKNLELNKELNVKEEMQEEASKKIQAILDSESSLLSKKCKETKNFKINYDDYKITPTPSESSRLSWDSYGFKHMKHKITPTPSESSRLSWDYYGFKHMKQSKIMNSTKRSNNSHSIASTSSTPMVSDDQGKTTEEKVMDHMDSADFMSKSISKDELLQDQVLAEYEAHRKDTECNSLINKINNVSGSLDSDLISEHNTELFPTESSPTSSADSSYIFSSEVIAPPSTPIFQSEDTSVEDSEKKEFTDSTINIHYIRNILSTFKSDSQPKTTNDEEIMDSMNSAELISTQMSKKVEVEDNDKKESTDSTINIHDIGNISSTSISDSQSITTNDEEIMDSMNFVELISTQMSKNELLQWAYIIFFIYVLLSSLKKEIIQKVTPSKPILVITYDKARKDKKSENIHDMKVKIHRKKCSSKCSTCLKCFIILLILILSLFLFQFYFRFGLVREERTDENDEYADIFATAIVELEEGILDHDATVRAVTKYIERDTPILKVVALIGDTSVDKPYTMDIIKKKLRKRRRNGLSPSFPTFIVLENLRVEHSKVVINYVNTYQEAYGNREFTILAVFKVEQIDDDSTRADLNHTINAVKDFFIKANIIMKIIPYKPLSEDTIEKHIRKTAKNIGQTFSQDQIDYYKRRLIEDDTDCQKNMVVRQ
ncbi:uncharacterized protein LOC115238161 [Formica exsecta]|uniref:uncharacterized protein LOC115238161 n=1 Tax=Formica exsecta TaxID=72781 RepID=UPI00114116E0|nr:uncharacterized protein LOC115238161 [Formica exsecta]XP_029667612.1 uncharacterized protein LOC115238161 [Formica exsecta]